MQARRRAACRCRSHATVTIGHVRPRRRSAQRAGLIPERSRILRLSGSLGNQAVARSAIGGLRPVVSPVGSSCRPTRTLQHVCGARVSLGDAVQSEIPCGGCAFFRVRFVHAASSNSPGSVRRSGSIGSVDRSETDVFRAAEARSCGRPSSSPRPPAALGCARRHATFVAGRRAVLRRIGSRRRNRQHCRSWFDLSKRGSRTAPGETRCPVGAGAAGLVREAGVGPSATFQPNSAWEKCPEMRSLDASGHQRSVKLWPLTDRLRGPWDRDYVSCKHRTL